MYFYLLFVIIIIILDLLLTLTIFVCYQIVLEADGYQPYLISPEKGLRSLIKGVLELAKEPSRLCVEEVFLFYHMHNEFELYVACFTQKSLNDCSSFFMSSVFLHLFIWFVVSVYMLDLVSMFFVLSLPFDCIYPTCCENMES